jgi:hypothetical protein
MREDPACATHRLDEGGIEMTTVTHRPPRLINVFVKGLLRVGVAG